MKKRFLVAAMAATLVSPLVANAAAEVYGKAHASYDINSGDDSTDNATISNRNSRLGVKGSEDLGGGLKVVYKMEFGVDVTGNDGFSNRNQYVGLSGGMGTVLLARHDTPMKMVQGKFDQFNDTIADMKAMVRGDDRISNVLAFVSPTMGGMKAIVALVPGEENGNTVTDANNGFADGISAGFTYDAKGVFVSLASNSGDAIADQMRLVGTYKMDAMQFGVLYSSTDGGDDAGLPGAYTGTEDEVSMGVSFGMKVSDAGKVKVQYIDATDVNGVANADETRTDIGYDHMLSKSTTVYAMYDTFSEADKDAISFGIVHNF